MEHLIMNKLVQTYVEALRLLYLCLMNQHEIETFLYKNTALSEGL